MEPNGAKIIVRIALAVVMIAICTYLHVPFAIPFTMQTFAVFFVLIFLGGKWGTAAIAAYVLLGAAGVPVFSGFKSGLAAITGATGGYIFGFILSGLVFWAFPLKKDRYVRLFLACFSGLFVCYLCGTLWFWLVVNKGSGAEGLWNALVVCVFPYIAADIVKIILAEVLAYKLKKIVN